MRPTVRTSTSEARPLRAPLALLTFALPLAVLAAPLRAEDQNPLRGSGDWPALRQAERTPPWIVPQTVAPPAITPRMASEESTGGDRPVVAASFRRTAERPEALSQQAAEGSAASSSTDQADSSAAAPSATPADLADTTQALGKQPGDGDDLSYQPPQYPEPVDLGDTLGRLMTATLGVLAICGTGLWAARKWLRRLPTAASGGEQSQVLSYVNLGSRCLVQLVELQGCKFIVGRDAGGIKAVTLVTQSFAESVEHFEHVSPPAA